MLTAESGDREKCGQTTHPACAQTPQVIPVGTGIGGEGEARVEVESQGSGLSKLKSDLLRQWRPGPRETFHCCLLFVYLLLLRYNLLTHVFIKIRLRFLASSIKPDMIIDTQHLKNNFPFEGDVPLPPIPKPSSQITSQRFKTRHQMLL